MAESTPLSTLLSQLLVAFTIEFDNEFEHRMPHRTTLDGGRGPWLVSMVMWSNFLRHLPADGALVGDVEDLIGLVNFGGLQR
ncbi:MAG: hypothetical protein J2P17_20520, partial [Mycobacterium sp.]|nr:hypothetical protein [Mycobacterium sp.]